MRGFTQVSLGYFKRMVTGKREISCGGGGSVAATYITSPLSSW